MIANGYRIHNCIIALFMAIFLTCCTTTEQQADNSSVRDRHDLEGRSLDSVLLRLGKDTDYDHTSRASDLGGEFYTPINAKFPPSDPASRNVLVREVRWGRGDRYIAVFCTRSRESWRVFNAVEWRKDIVF